jgi:hypothetical protein
MLSAGPNFKGIKMIPPGPHFVYYSSSSRLLYFVLFLSSTFLNIHSLLLLLLFKKKNLFIYQRTAFGLATYNLLVC